MTYCSAADVQSLAPTRKLGQGNNPTETDVLVYIEGVESEINAILTNKGYAIPVLEELAPLAFQFLRRITAQGAVAQLEASSANNPAAADKAEKVYQGNLKLISEAREILDAPQDTERDKPRGPGVTNVEASPGQEPFFSRSERKMQF